MSVRPITVINTNTPNDMKASMLAFAAYKKSCEKNYVSLATKKLEDGKKTTKASDLVKGEIKFAKVRLEEDKLLSKMIEERVRNTNEPIQISNMLAEMIKIKNSKSEELSL